tara:strand:+ start:468 stop:743 length:276 start_codon:yes stop_codon:yes gene_type:complete
MLFFEFMFRPDILSQLTLFTYGSLRFKLQKVNTKGLQFKLKTTGCSRNRARSYREVWSSGSWLKKQGDFNYQYTIRKGMSTTLEQRILELE